MFFIHRTCFCLVLWICLEGVRDSLLLLLCFFCCFGCLEKSLLSVQFVLVARFFGLVVFSVCALLIWCVSASFVFFVGSGLFFSFHFFVIFGFFSWNCLFFIVLSSCCFFCFMSWLLACLCGFLGCLFRGTLSGSRLGMTTQEGSIYFSFFFQNRGVWVKTGAGVQDEGFCKLFVASTTSSKRPKQTAVFSLFCCGKRYKNRGFQNFVQRKAFHHYFRFGFGVYLLSTRKYIGARFGVCKEP